MPEKALFENIQWSYAWLATWAGLWGGMVSYFRRVQKGQPPSILSAAMHMSMSGFAGLMCWLGCLQLDVPGPLTAVVTGLAGHMGAEFVKILEDGFKSRLRATIKKV